MSFKDDILQREGLVRTDVECHSCGEQSKPKMFIARVDHSLNGNHEIKCPRCGHLHFRVVKDGKITEDRYNSNAGPTYKADSEDYAWGSMGEEKIQAMTAQHFLRDLWLNRDR